MSSRQLRRGRWVFPIGLGAVLALGVTACSTTSSGDSTAAPAPSAPGAPPSSVDVTPRNDLRDEHPVAWTRSEVVGDRQVRVYFSMGSPRCYGVRAAVTPTSASIGVSVWQGTVPGAPEICTMEALEASLLLTTPDPIAGRPIVQG